MLPAGSTIGILGGGQLGWMLSLAAKDLGYPCHIFAPEENPPAMQAAAHHTSAEFSDFDALKAFAESVDVITYEFENVPAMPLRFLRNTTPILPTIKSLEITQDRLEEKNFIKNLGISTTLFEPFDNKDSLLKALSKTGFPSIAKTRQLGYDGKGQYWIRYERKESDISDYFNVIDALENARFILESAVEFSQEFAVVATRDKNGNTRCFDVIATYHKEGILRKAKCPAGLHPNLEAYAQEATVKIADALEHVGVLTAEFFLLGDINDGTNASKRILVNEIAPRVHNSGHLTRESCVANQFEQHIRAICGLDLGDTTRTKNAEMINLLGEEVNDWKAHTEESGTYVTLYGKEEARPGRKMGHVVRVQPVSR